ncbi:MAG: XRE family transcriptional regulator [Clostridia bacterium]|nr:XRE family transcriptional regulator [Clostridia bacterium]
MNTEMTFGEFIIAKRKEKDISARQLALAINISPVYMCDIEKGRKFAISDELLDKIRKVLILSENEVEKMYDLAAIARNTVSADLPEYIMENQIVRTALRTAKKNQISDEKWERFIKEMIEKEE